MAILYRAENSCATLAPDELDMAGVPLADRLPGGAVGEQDSGIQPQPLGFPQPEGLTGGGP